MIARFRDDHDRLRVLADRLDRHLAAPTPPQGPEFAQLRWTLVRELSMHLAVERRTIEDWRARSGAPVERFDFALDDAFVRHVADWSGASVATAWDRYRGEARGLLTRLRARMAAEERELFPAVR